MSQAEQNKARAHAFLDALNRGDTEAIIAAYAPGGQVRTMGQTLISGTFTRDQISGAANAIFEAFPEGIRFTVSGITAEAQRVAVEAQSEGLHSSGQVYRNEYHFLFVFDDQGKILELKEYMDTERVTDVLCGGQRPVVTGDGSPPP